jgi:hypothetical protein
VEWILPWGVRSQSRLGVDSPPKTDLDNVKSNRIEVDMRKPITKAILHLLLGQE